MKCIICGKEPDIIFGSGKFCSKSCICKYASLKRSREVLNIINEKHRGNKHSEETKKKIGNSIKNTISNYSEEEKRMQKKAHSIKHKPHKPYKKWSMNSRMKQSLNTTTRINSGKGHCKYYSVYNGKRFIKVQGTWEQRIGIALTKLNIKWERIILSYDNYKHYTPDFYLPEYDIYLEVKGWMSEKNIQKYKDVINELHITLKLIDNIQLIKDFEEGRIKVLDFKNFIEQYDV